jgi:hypothetical protein
LYCPPKIFQAFEVSSKMLSGDLEGEEEEAGAAGVDLVGGDSVDDFVEGEVVLEGVDWHGEVEALAGDAAGAALVGVGDAASRGVMVVAELLPAEGR